MPQTNIMRHQIADYLTVGEQDYLMNTGFTSLGHSPGAQEETTQYVGDVASSTTVTSYQTEFPYNAELILEQEATNALYETGDEQKTGSGAMFTYTRVMLYKPVEGLENTYEAKQYRVSNVVSDGPADPGKAVFSGTLKQVGAFKKGTYNVSERKFTETVV